jgi:GTP-binding protein Era
MFKSGFVAIIGEPNVGKSTFLNAVIGEKVAITSSKPQTTRYRVDGIYHSDAGQIVFVDTPGIHAPKSALAKRMVDVAMQSLHDVDLILYLVSAVEPITEVDERIIERLKTIDTPVFLVLNKIDKAADMIRLEALVEKYKALHDFDLVVSISALQKTFLKALIDDIFNVLDEGEAFYPKEVKTNRSKRFLMAELIREKILQFTQQEVPHSSYVSIENIAYDDQDLLEVRAHIVVERDTQKKIIIGKDGLLIKRIGTLARRELVPLLGEKIFLDLHVKVDPKWRQNVQTVDRLFQGDFE